MVEAFYAVLIALVHGIDADEAGTIIGGGRATFSDRYAVALGFGPVPPPGRIALCPAQVVEMRHRDRGQAFIPGIAKDLDGALHQAAGGRPREGAVERIGLGQQRYVDRRELAGKALFGRRIALGEGLARLRPAHQAFQLRARVAGGALQIVHHHPFIGSGKTPIAQPLHHRGNEGVALGILTLGFKLHRLRAV